MCVFSFVLAADFFDRGSKKKDMLASVKEQKVAELLSAYLHAGSDLFLFLGALF